MAKTKQKKHFSKVVNSGTLEEIHRYMSFLAWMEDNQEAIGLDNIADLPPSQLGYFGLGWYLSANLKGENRQIYDDRLATAFDMGQEKVSEYYKEHYGGE